MTLWSSEGRREPLPSDSNFTAEVAAEHIGGPTIDIDKVLSGRYGRGVHHLKGHQRRMTEPTTDIDMVGLLISPGPFIKGLQWYTGEAEERSAWTQ
jgi:hypothetical protein